MVENDIAKEKRFFERVNRILSGNYQITVKNGGSLAMSDTKKDIFIPFSQESRKNDSYEEYLRSLKSFNYHELAHTLFTSIEFEEFIRKVGRKVKGSYNWNTVKKIINRIEDQRVEMRFSTLYPKVKVYFADTFVRCLRENEHVCWLDAYGLKFLPDTLVERERKKFLENRHYIDEEDIDELEELIDEYISLQNSEKEEMIRIMVEIVDIVNQNRVTMKGVFGGQFSEGYKKPFRKDKREELQDEVEDEVEDGHDTLGEQIEEIEEEEEQEEEEEEKSEQEKKGEDWETEEMEEIENEDEMSEEEMKKTMAAKMGGRTDKHTFDFDDGGSYILECRKDGKWEVEVEE